MYLKYYQSQHVTNKNGDSYIGGWVLTQNIMCILNLQHTPFQAGHISSAQQPQQWGLAWTVSNL